MQIVVQLEAGTARLFQQQRREEAAASELAQVLAQWGLALQALHPGSSDPVLSGFFHIDVQDQDSAARAIERLLQVGGVEAAYLKPRDETP
ncbi:hypothetical protein [Massilia sp. BJB1822]|uniref:hypothetical protein n=1 Tax=Massilia sp. BJB1822 TaxID=2744470 RepID=UPI001593E346|nr:hypothetical protein [Massilia sp. BJB1822]NVD96477.1 hypothetical protein [Massilia sp. BJB1822]